MMKWSTKAGAQKGAPGLVRYHRALGAELFSSKSRFALAVAGVFVAVPATLASCCSTQYFVSTLKA